MSLLPIRISRPTPNDVAKLANDHSLGEIAAIYGRPVNEIRSMMPTRAPRYELVNLARAGRHQPGQRWPVRSRRLGYRKAQLLGLVEHVVEPRR